jgi:hypothetical protein
MMQQLLDNNCKILLLSQKRTSNVTTFFKKKWQKLCQFGDNPSDNIIVVDDQLTHRLYLTIHTASLHFQGAQPIQIAGLKEV